MRFLLLITIVIASNNGGLEMRFSWRGNRRAFVARWLMDGSVPAQCSRAWAWRAGRSGIRCRVRLVGIPIDHWRSVSRTAAHSPPGLSSGAAPEPGGASGPREGGLRMTGADRCAGRVSRIGGAVLPAPPFLRHRGAGQGSHRGALSRVRRGGPLPEHLAGDADVVRRRTLAPIVALKSSIPYGLGGSFPCAEQH